VLVVDDSEVVRRGICQILQSQADIEIICEASDGADAVRKVREHRPDVVLLDITMPVMNGFEAARRIKHEFPSTLILIVSQFDSAPFTREAAAAGASGYVVKSNASSALIPALRKMMQSQRGRTDAEVRTSPRLEILTRTPDSWRTSPSEEACSGGPRLTPRPTSEPEN